MVWPVTPLPPETIKMGIERLYSLFMTLYLNRQGLPRNSSKSVAETNVLDFSRKGHCLMFQVTKFNMLKAVKDATFQSDYQELLIFAFKRLTDHKQSSMNMKLVA